MSKHMKIFGSVLGMVFFLTSAAVARADGHQHKKGEAAKGPVAARQSLSDDGRMQIDAKDRCPVCGMFPAKRPKSAAAMVMDDGRTFYFCGNGCLLRTWHHSKRYLSSDRTAIARMVVLDYFSGAPIDAHKAYWVAGSDVIGPMGPALVALQDKASVDQFKARHGGKTIFQLAEMNDALWAQLFPKKSK